MPNFTFYSRASTDSNRSSYIYVSAEEIQQYEEYLRQCAYQDGVIEQMLQEEEQLKKDKRKYPLFFLKDGIV